MTDKIDKIIEIRDRRNGDWYWVHKAVLAHKKLRATDKLVYSALAYFANTYRQDSFPSYSTIVELTGLSKRGIQNSIRRLEANEIVRVVRRKGRYSKYILLKVTEAKYASVSKPRQNNIQPRQTSTHTEANGTHEQELLTRIINKKGLKNLRERMVRLGLKN